MDHLGHEISDGLEQDGVEWEPNSCSQPGHHQEWAIRMKNDNNETSFSQYRRLKILQCVNQWIKMKTLLHYIIS